MQKQFQPPKTWKDLEYLCCDLWKIELHSFNMQLNGREGSEQYGVDCFGQSGSSSAWIGIQCKEKQIYPEKTLKIDAIRTEIKKAKTFKPALTHYIIVTTARRAPKLQEIVRIESEKLSQDGFFSLQVCFWDDIEELLNKHQDVAKAYYKEYYQNDLSDLDRKLFLIKNPTTLELKYVKLQKWIASDFDYLSFYLDNTGEIPAEHVTVSIFKKSPNDVKIINDTVNSSFLNQANLCISGGNNLLYPLTNISDIAAQFPESFSGYTIIGAGLSPNIPAELKEFEINKKWYALGCPKTYQIRLNTTTFPLFVKLTYKSPFDVEHITHTGCYIYLMEN
ncbi:hypothetical protein [Aeromonas veronii]|uniref:hypothetical protein n=1 Tax=Aeromonas veronii TaxID=654 RepID=UPI003D250A8C